MVACLRVIFKPAWNNFICVFLCACALFQLNPKQTKQTDGSWCGALKRSTAVDVTLAAFRCTSFRSACCLLLFLVCRRMRNASRQTSVDVTETNAKLQYSWCGTQNSLCFHFWFLRSSTERGNSLQRCHNTCSDARHQRCLKGKLQVTQQVTSQVLCLAGLFSSFWCVCEGWKQFQLIK